MKTKKGFTVVELVIVIAIIAVLAAVLIPTFTTLIKKANVSLDVQLAKNMNTAIAVGKAEGKEINSFYDVVYLIKENGFLMGNLNPSAEGNYFGWESVSGMIYYLNDNLEVIYPEKATYEASNMYIPVSSTEAKDALLAKNSLLNVILAPKTEDNLVDFVIKINDGTLTGNQQIVLADDIVLTTGTGTASGTKSLTFNKAGSVVDLILGTQTISVNEAQSVAFGSNRVLQVNDGTLNVKGGKIISDNNSYGSILGNGGVLTVVDTEIQNCKKNGFSIKNLNSTAALDNVTINSTIGGCFAVDGSNDPTTSQTITVNSGNYYQNIYGDFCSAVIGIGGGGAITVNDGSFICEKGDAVVRSFSSPGSITINGGTFKAVGQRTDSNDTTKAVNDDTDTFLFYIDAIDASHYSTYSNRVNEFYVHGGDLTGKIFIASGSGSGYSGKLVIDGGTFNGTNYKDVVWDNILVGSGYNIAVEGDVITITR